MSATASIAQSHQRSFLTRLQHMFLPSSALDLVVFVFITVFVPLIFSAKVYRLSFESISRSSLVEVVLTPFMRSDRPEFTLPLNASEYLNIGRRLLRACATP